jgi:TRAP-type C4-dicarboxylate transport system permease small subunit
MLVSHVNAVIMTHHLVQTHAAVSEITMLGFAAVAGLVGVALAAPAADKITSLPGWPAGTPLPEMYSGYVSVFDLCRCVVRVLQFISATHTFPYPVCFPRTIWRYLTQWYRATTFDTSYGLA